MISPDEALGDLFSDVQRHKIYSDGKVFVDMIPQKRLSQIKKEYELLRHDPQFDLRDFVARHFHKYGAYDSTYVTDPSMTPRQHIRELWGVLERKNRRDRGSLLALPKPYIVPGGRFSEMFYWDSYFIMLGLAADGRWGMIENMMKNYVHLIRMTGFIPTASRTYFLSRSQPPFFSHMVKLLASKKGRYVLAEYLPYMLIEYRFWMKGRNRLAKREYKSFARVVEMSNGTHLNRYYDNKTTPRPESLREDTETAAVAADREADRLYLHLRAAAESGWDFSSRWFDDPQDISSIYAADIIPVDLNSLLYHLEMTIFEGYQYLKQPMMAKRFKAAADRRERTIQAFLWDEDDRFFGDYNFHRQELTGHKTLAAAYPLFVKIATADQAEAVAERLEAEFLKEGGLVTTLVDNGQQWDSPNGWAPLQWVAIEGLRNYGFYQLADQIKKRWIATNVNLFTSTGKMVEKYDVVNSGVGGGGEYPLQDGFGWTNGVLAALLEE